MDKYEVLLKKSSKTHSLLFKIRENHAAQGVLKLPWISHAGDHFTTYNHYKSL